MKIEFYSGLLFFAVAVTTGCLVGLNSRGGSVWIASDAQSVSGQSVNGRNPAAIKHEMNFSKIDGAELLQANQRRVISAARVESRADEIDVVLGHFATQDENGSRRLACDSEYNRISLHFLADGMADAGERPSMTVEAPCRSALQDLGSIDAIMIPYNKIMKQKPTNTEMSFEEGVTFKFEDMMPDWPLHWALDSVRVFNTENANQQVTLNNREIRDIRGAAFMIHWQDTDRVPAESRH